jgi:two-component system cell cycle sensor histidine kinase/response regulator CckA
MPFGEYVRVSRRYRQRHRGDHRQDFRPFYTPRILAGYGAGTSTVYGIVKQTGGFICELVWQGTIFRIFLPRYIPVADDLAVPHCRRRRRRSPAPSPLDAMRGRDRLTGHGTILLVEDEEELRALNGADSKSRLYRDRGRQRRRGARSLNRADKSMSWCPMYRAGNGRPDLMKELKQPNLTSRSSSGYAETRSTRPCPTQAVQLLANRSLLKQLVTVVGDDGGVSRRRMGPP